jgi:hypothetical protein
VNIECLDAPVREYILSIKAEADTKIHSLEKQVAFLTEQMSLMRYKRFGRSSEELPTVPSLPFFADETKPIPPPSVDDTITVPAHKRKKPGRKPIDPRLPRVTTLIDVPKRRRLAAAGRSS